MRFFRPPRVLSVHWVLSLHTVQLLLNVTAPTNRDITTSPTSAQLDLTKTTSAATHAWRHLSFWLPGSPYRIAETSRLRPPTAMAISPRATSKPPARAMRQSSRPVFGSCSAATAGAAAGAVAAAGTASAGLVTTAARTSAGGSGVGVGVGVTTVAGVKELTKLALRFWSIFSVTLRPLLLLTAV